MNIKFKKLSILLLISGATLIFADAQTTDGQSYQEKKQDLNLTNLQRKTFIAIAGDLKYFGDINKQDNFLAPSVKVGGHRQPSDHSFKAFRSAIFQFIEDSSGEDDNQIKSNFGEFFSNLVDNADDNFLDRSVQIPTAVPLNGRSARSFSQYVDGIIDRADW